MKNLNGKSITLLLVDSKQVCCVYRGTVLIEKRKKYFINDKGAKVPLPPATYSPIKRVSEDLKDIFLGSEYFIQMRVREMPESPDQSTYNTTGLKWLK